MSRDQERIATLEKLIELVRKHGIHALEIEEGGARFSVTATPPGGSTVMPQMFAQQPMHAPYPMPPQASMQIQHAPPPPSFAPPSSGETEPKAAKKVPGKGRVVHSPFVGTFYRSASPGSDPFVEIGKRVKKGDALCIIEAMKLMNEIEAEGDGVIKEILVENESPVEFDQPLFVME